MQHSTRSSVLLLIRSKEKQNYMFTGSNWNLMGYKTKGEWLIILLNLCKFREIKLTGKSLHLWLTIQMSISPDIESDEMESLTYLVRTAMTLGENEEREVGCSHSLPNNSHKTLDIQIMDTYQQYTMCYLVSMWHLLEKVPIQWQNVGQEDLVIIALV